MGGEDEGVLRGEGGSVETGLKSGEAKGSISFVAKSRSASCEDVEVGSRNPCGAKLV